MVEPQTATNVAVTFSADLVNPGRHRIVSVVTEDGKEVSSETLGEEDYFFDTFAWKWEVGERKGGGEGQSYTTEPISLRPGVYSVSGRLPDGGGHGESRSGVFLLYAGLTPDERYGHALA